jgi:signal transduction histidine kinase
MIEALLTLTKVQGGLDRQEVFDLAAVTGQSLAARRHDAEERGVTLRTDLSPATMQGDPHLIERLVTNLIDNALQHNVSAGRVEITTNPRPGRAVLSVINTGPVVPDAATDRLLQPFQRLGPDRTSHDKGVGLGLSIVQAISDAHGADLSLQPKAGGGLKVEVLFPAPTRTKGSKPAEPTPEPSQPPDDRHDPWPAVQPLHYR